LVLMFDLPEDCPELDEMAIQKLQNELDVSVTVKPKPRQVSVTLFLNQGESVRSAVALCCVYTGEQIPSGTGI